MTGKDLKTVRDALGMTQEAFAANFGFNVYTVRAWEQGRRSLPKDKARLIKFLLIHKNK